MNKLNRLYVIDYYINNKIKESININNPKSVVITIDQINKLKYQQRYKQGILKRRCINLKEVIRFNNKYERSINRINNI